jgi:hypothetical protein
MNAAKFEEIVDGELRRFEWRLRNRAHVRNPMKRRKFTNEQIENVKRLYFQCLAMIHKQHESDNIQ